MSALKTVERVIRRLSASPRAIRNFTVRALRQEAGAGAAYVEGLSAQVAGIVALRPASKENKRCFFKDELVFFEIAGRKETFASDAIDHANLQIDLRSSLLIVRFTLT